MVLMPVPYAGGEMEGVHNGTALGVDSCVLRDRRSRNMTDTTSLVSKIGVDVFREFWPRRSE
jgi:hypothetical protein